MPTTVDVTQIDPINITDSPIAAEQVLVEQIQPIELVPLTDNPDGASRFTKTMGNVLSDMILQSEHGLASAIGVFLLKPSGEEVSVQWQISGSTVNILSNINLLNHKLIIF